jgi:hypothetical protein
MTMPITPGLTIIELQTDAHGCKIKFYAWYDGNAHSLASTPLLGGALVSASNPLPIADEGATPPLAYVDTPPVEVSPAPTPLIAAGQFAKSVTFQTKPGETGNVYLNVSGGAASVGRGICITAGGGTQSFGTPDQPMPQAAISAISDSGSVAVMIAGA